MSIIKNYRKAANFYDRIKRDIDYTFRMIRNNLFYSLVLIIIMAGTNGVVGSIFSILQETALRDLPVSNPEELAMVGRYTEIGREPVIGQMFEPIQSERQLISGIAGFGGARMPVTNNGVTYPVSIGGIKGDFFEILGASPQIGRFLLSGESDATAVISDGFWHRYFAGDPDAVGSNLTLGTETVTVIGVAAAEFTGFEPQVNWDIVVPWNVMIRSLKMEFAPSPIEIVARLKKNVTATEYEAQINTIWPAVVKSTVPFGLTFESWHKIMGDRVRILSARRGISRLLEMEPAIPRVTKISFSFSILIFLMGCFTVMLLTVVRSRNNIYSTSVKEAVGGTKMRIIRPYIIEILIITLLGYGISLIAVVWGSKVGASFLPEESTVIWRINIDVLLCVLLLLLSLFMGGLACLITCSFSFQKTLGSILQTFNTSKRHTGIRVVLLTAQVIVSVFIVYYAVVYIQDLTKLKSVDIGFDTDNLYYYSLNGKPPVKNLSPEYFNLLTEQIDELPGIDGAALTLSMPPILNDQPSRAMIKSADDKIELQASRVIVSPAYFETLGLPIDAGGDFLWNDKNVAIITKNIAESLPNGLNSIGDMIIVEGYKNPFRITGITGNVAYNGPRYGNQNIVFLNYNVMGNQLPSNYGMDLVIRSKSNSYQIRKEIESIVERLGSQYIYRIDDQNKYLLNSMRNEKAMATLLGWSGVVILILIGAGLFGFCNYVLDLRKKELAIRTAVGAAKSDIAFCLLKEIFITLIIGLFLGSFLIVLSHKVLGKFFFDFYKINGVNLFISVMIIAIVAVVSVVKPFIKASKVNMTEKLKTD